MIMTKHKILITGTSRGIGKDLTEHYLKEGHEVWGCARSESSIEHSNYTHSTLDLTDERQVLEMFDEISKANFQFDVLINNAAKASMNSIMLTPFDTVRRIMDINVSSLFLISREAARSMLINKIKGRIVNFSSIAASLSLEGEAAYSASKAAVESLSRTMSRELASAGITVNTIGVSLYRSGLTKGVPSCKLEAVLEKQPINRWAKISDVTNTVDYFIAPASDFITGQVIYFAGI